jgi:hypothetical protein
MLGVMDMFAFSSRGPGGSCKQACLQVLVGSSGVGCVGGRGAVHSTMNVSDLQVLCSACWCVVTTVNKTVARRASRLLVMQLGASSVSMHHHLL